MPRPRVLIILLIASSAAALQRVSIARTSSNPCLRAWQPCLQAREPATVRGGNFLLPEPALAIGSSLLLLLVINRLFTDDLLNSQSRADLIATIAPVLIVLKALADLDITPKEAEPVVLDGAEVAWVEPSLRADLRDELEWAADTLMGCEACAAVALHHEGRTLMLRGVLPSESAVVVPGPLLTKCMQRTNGAPDYLPALQLLPGRVEFRYLPSLTQGVLMLPLVGSTGALVLACDRQRGFTEEDVAWARAIAARLGACLMDTKPPPI